MVACVAPVLGVRYLPSTDLPQHVAVAAILAHARDEGWGFAEFYRVELSRAPYLLPYALAAAASRVVSLDTAMRCVVALGIVAQLAGTWLLLRALRKPSYLLLLAVPLVFHRGFFWGFVHFQLALGLALLAIGLLAQVPSRRRSAALWAVAAALALTHVYGVLLFVGFAITLWAVSGRDTARRGEGVVAAAAAAAAWWVLSGIGKGDGRGWSPSWRERLLTLPENVLGGWADASESLVLVAFAATLLVLTASALPVTPSRWRRLEPLERAVWAVVVANLVLYAVLPQATSSAKFIHFRHAVIAAIFLPVLARRAAASAAPLVGAALLVVTGVGAWANALDHLVLFDREARTFDAVLERIPNAPRLALLAVDARGNVARQPTYLHFGAYAQAKRGGVLAASFPELFWNIPVAWREDTSAPPTPPDLEWKPRLFATPAMTSFYDWLIVRVPRQETYPETEDFPYELVYADPPWQMYRRRAAAARAEQR